LHCQKCVVIVTPASIIAKNAQTDLDGRRPRRSPTPSTRNTEAKSRRETDFDGLVAGLEAALAYAKVQPNRGTRETAVVVDRTFVAAARLEAGLTRQEFARVAGGSLGTVRKWERGERSPTSAARMLARILARDPALVIAEAGLAEGTWKRRGGEAG
jgi:putative transcriptional regulator